MATATAAKLRNFIDGEPQDPAEGRTEEVLNPATAEPFAVAPVSSAEDVDQAVTAARRAFDSWSRTTPKERSEAILRLAATIADHAEELAELESADAGKPRASVLEEEMPGNLDNLRFFAGAARCLEGLAAGEFVRGAHLDHPPRAGGRRRSDHPLELPALDGGVEAGAGAGHREHGGPEAGRGTPP